MLSPYMSPVERVWFYSLRILCGLILLFLVLPVLVGIWSGDPVRVAAIGMLAGFCGTLMTPMAANFNIVPVALLELPDKYAVIKAQMPTALMMLVVNIVLLYTLM